MNYTFYYQYKKYKYPQFYNYSLDLQLAAVKFWKTSWVVLTYFNHIRQLKVSKAEKI